MFISILTGLAITGAGMWVGHLLGDNDKNNDKTGNTPVIEAQKQKPTFSQRAKSAVGTIADVATVIGLIYAGWSFVWARFPDKILAVFKWISPVLVAFNWILVVFMAAFDMLALNCEFAIYCESAIFGRALGTVAGIAVAEFLVSSLEAAAGVTSGLIALGSAAGMGAGSLSGALVVFVVIGFGGMAGEMLEVRMKRRGYCISVVEYIEDIRHEKPWVNKAANVVTVAALCYVAVCFVVVRFLI